MLIWLLATALAAPISGRVTLDRRPVPDAQVVAYGANGVPAGIAAYTDRDGRFTVEVPEDGAVHVERWVRFDGGARMLALADVHGDDASRIALDRMDVGGGAVRLMGGRLDRAGDVMKGVRKRYAALTEACEAVLDVDDRAVAREQATVHAAALSIGYGTGFEGCALRRFGETSSVEVAERTTHNLDAAAGPGGQPLWAGLASVGFAEWALRNGEYARARRAAGAAVTRLGGLTSSQGGTPVAEAARIPLARAYEIDGDAAMAEQDPPGAVSKYYQALRVYKQIGDVGGMGRSELGIARSELARGRLGEAAEHLAEALNLPLTATHRAMLAEAESTLLRAQVEQAAAEPENPNLALPAPKEGAETPAP
ncbi:MAG: hypothetical protein ACI855_000456 [Myxococcota bacterium]